MGVRVPSQPRSAEAIEACARHVETRPTDFSPVGDHVSQVLRNEAAALRALLAPAGNGGGGR
jgi:hypothetical protein